jgi:hypothetical protein
MPRYGRSSASWCADKKEIWPHFVASIRPALCPLMRSYFGIIAYSSFLIYAKFYSRSHDAVIRVYDEGDNVIETHEHVGDFNAL